mgnify:CR=1 FL=1
MPILVMKKLVDNNYLINPSTLVVQIKCILCSKPKNFPIK